MISPIAGVSDETPKRTPEKTGKKSPDKAGPEDASPHKKTQKPDPPRAAPVAAALFDAGAGDPEDPKKDPKDPPGPGGGGGPSPPILPPIGPPGAGQEPKCKKMCVNRSSMKDVPLYKEGDDPIAFVTSFMSYLNYYDIDPTTKILKEGDAGFVSVADSNKEIKKHYTDLKTLLGRALQR